MEDEGGACERDGCTGVLSPRLGKFGIFWGCSSWNTSARCKFTRRVRKPDKSHDSVVVLEAESINEFRLSLRLPPAARGQSRRKRKREPRNVATDEDSGASQNKDDAGQDPRPLMLQDVVALLGKRPIRLDTRSDGLLGAVYSLPGWCQMCIDSLPLHRLTASLACQITRKSTAILPQHSKQRHTQLSSWQFLHQLLQRSVPAHQLMPGVARAEARMRRLFTNCRLIFYPPSCPSKLKG